MINFKNTSSYSTWKWINPFISKEKPYTANMQSKITHTDMTECCEANNMGESFASQTDVEGTNIDQNAADCDMSCLTYDINKLDNSHEEPEELYSNTFLKDLFTNSDESMEYELLHIEDNVIVHSVDDISYVCSNNELMKNKETNRLSLDEKSPSDNYRNKKDMSLSNRESLALLDEILMFDICMEIRYVNDKMPNLHKWAICTNQLKDMMLICLTGPVSGEAYDDGKIYNIRCSLGDLRQIEWLRDFIEQNYKPTEIIEKCPMRNTPLHITPFEYRFIYNQIRSGKVVQDETMMQYMDRITPENFVIAMIITHKFKYQWDPYMYNNKPPVYFRFLARYIYPPSTSG